MLHLGWCGSFLVVFQGRFGFGISEKHFCSASHFFSHFSPGIFPQGHLWQILKLRTCIVLGLFFDLSFGLVWESLPGAIFLHISPYPWGPTWESPLQLWLQIHHRWVPLEMEWGRVVPLNENLEPHGRVEPASYSQLTLSAHLPELHANVWSSEFLA